MNREVDAASATEQLFTQYRGDVYRYARFTLGDPVAAEDVVQEVFLRVLRSWGQFKGKASVRTWLWTVVRSCVIDYTRRHRRDRDATPFEERMAGEFEMQTAAVEVEEMLRSLPCDQRQVVVLRLIEDWSTADAAKALGWSESKVKVTLHRAVARIREEEMRHGGVR